MTDKKKAVDPAELERKKELKRLRKARETERSKEEREREKRAKRSASQKKDVNQMKQETLQDLKDWKEIDYWKRMKKLKKKERLLEKERIAAAGADGREPSPRIRKEGLTIEFAPSPEPEKEQWKSGSAEGILVPAVPAPPETATTSHESHPNGAITITTEAQPKTGDSGTEKEERLDLTEENVPVAHETDDEEEKKEVFKPRSPRRDMPGHRYSMSLSSDKKSPRLLKREFYTSASLSLSSSSAQPPPPPPPPFPAHQAQFSQEFTSYREKKKGHYEGNFHPIHKKVL